MQDDCQRRIMLKNHAEVMNTVHIADTYYFWWPTWPSPLYCTQGVKFVPTSSSESNYDAGETKPHSDLSVDVVLMASRGKSAAL